MNATKIEGASVEFPTTVPVRIQHQDKNGLMLMVEVVNVPARFYVSVEPNVGLELDMKPAVAAIREYRLR